MIPRPLLVVTDRHGAERPLVETVRAVLEGGARWIWFRDRDMEPETRRRLAIALLALTRAHGARLSIGGDPALAAAIGADGVQLGGLAGGDPTLHPHRETQAGGGSLGKGEGSGASAGEDLGHQIIAARAGLGTQALVGVSAHTPRDIRAAAASGADYATLSPLFASVSKPGYGPALGLGALREAAGLGLPVIALGGIDAGNAPLCLEAGAAGIAVMGALMRADDPEAETRRLLDALRARCPRRPPDAGSKDGPAMRQGAGAGARRV